MPFYFLRWSLAAVRRWLAIDSNKCLLFVRKKIDRVNFLGLSRLGRNRLGCVKMVVDGVELDFDLELRPAHLGVGNAYILAPRSTLFYFTTASLNA